MATRWLSQRRRYKVLTWIGAALIAIGATVAVVAAELSWTDDGMAFWIVPGLVLIAAGLVVARLGIAGERRVWRQRADAGYVP